MRIVLRTLRLLLLGLWLGAAIFFGAAVAPNLFSVLRAAQLPNATEIAGTVVSRLLAIINVAGCIIALFGIATAYFSGKLAGRRVRVAEVLSLAIVAIMTGVSRWVISARMAALRGAMQAPIEMIARDDSRRVAFDSLHHYSVVVMGVAILAGLTAFVIMAGARNRT